MGQLERIIIVSDRASDLDNYEKYVANKHGTLSPQIEPIGEVPIYRCADLEGVNDYLATSGFTLREEFEKRLKEIYDDATIEGDPVRILAVDDDSWVCTYLEHSLPFQRYTLHNLDSGNQVLVLIRDCRRSVDTATDAQKAFELFKKGSYQALLTDLWMPDQSFRARNPDDWDKLSILHRVEDEELNEGSQGITLIRDVLDHVARNNLTLPLIVPFSSQWEHPRIRQLYAASVYRRCGVGILPKHYAFEYVQRSTFDDVLNSILLSPEMSTSIYNTFLNVLKFGIEEMLKRKRLIDDFMSVKTEFVGNTERVLEIIRAIVNKVAPSSSTVLITGETGTGKELIADIVHKHSSRNHGPFIKINCAAIPKELFESELFGHEKGSFTGAHIRQIGLFETANGGTLFLDEISELELSVQAKLLRALQQRNIRRVGGNEEIALDVRLVAATSKDLRELVSRGDFRDDLYYRIKVISINIPPLRDRKPDVILLAQHFIRRECGKTGRPESYLSGEAERLLVDYDWPGNVRELESAIESALVNADEVIQPDDLPAEILERNDASQRQGFNGTNNRWKAENLQKDVEELERQYITGALEVTGNNKKKTAELLDWSRNTLDERLERYKIKIRKVKETL